MKKLKISKFLLILSLVLILIGLCGSVLIAMNGIERADSYVRKNTNMVTSKVFTQADPIPVIDLRDFPIDILEIEKSTDGKNNIELTYNQLAYTAQAEVDAVFPEKLNIHLNPLKPDSNQQTNTFDFVKETLQNAVFGRRWFGQSAFFRLPLPQIKVRLQLTSAAEILVRNIHEIFDVKLDKERISNRIDLRYNNYIEEVFWQSLSFNKEMVNYTDSELYLSSYKFFSEDLKIQVSLQDKLYIAGSPQKRFPRNIINLDLEQVKETVIDLSGFFPKLNLHKANSVQIYAEDAVPTVIEYVENGETKTYRIDARTFAETADDDQAARNLQNLEEQVIHIEAQSITIVKDKQRIQLK